MDWLRYDNMSTLEVMREEALQGGGEDAVEIQHGKGKLTARERIDLLLDEGSFEEFDILKTGRGGAFGKERRYASDGVVTGHGTIDGREVFIFSQDFTIIGGSLGEAHSQKICKVMDHAVRVGSPIIGLNDSGGARIQEGVDALAAYGEIFNRNVMASGVVPQISCIMGPCAGGAVYSPAITDFTFMVENSAYMFVTGPNVVKTVTHQDISSEDLGGAQVHSEKSGVVHFVFHNDIICMREIRRLISYLPSNNKQKAPLLDLKDPDDRTDPALDYLIPPNPKDSYDMRVLINSILDGAEFMEIQASFARNIICGLGRLGGQTIGLVANQPAVLAGVLDCNASTKAARFVRFCNSFNIPLICLVDVPGFMPGPEQEHGGIIRHGAKLLYAFIEATVPRITVILRKAYGGAYLVMNAKHIGCDINYAWPTAEIAVLGPKGAAEVIYGKEIRSAPDPETLLSQKTEEYRKTYANPFLAAQRGYIDDVIFPRYTRRRLIRGLQFLEGKKADRPDRKHGNIPL
ncbi:Propionyl-CoA carboxylase beta chain [uncultured Desulfobacterium sp.]|uniref:Propionyl-CoA carboxylase beta chain n=1 Tax=uncultured Desulfobacterium sp. TaxID=201089 RepID=A0A445MZ40_9BACT|nr:Propionyl-CoA carboxylase beta chain [uncultured Desulfobacterium sp.]